MSPHFIEKIPRRNSFRIKDAQRPPRHLLGRPDAPAHRPRIRSSPFEREIFSFESFRWFWNFDESFLNVQEKTSTIAETAAPVSHFHGLRVEYEISLATKKLRIYWPPYCRYSLDCRWTATSRKVTSSFIWLSQRLDHEQVGSHTTCCVVWFLLTLKCPCKLIHQRNAQCSNAFFTKTLKRTNGSRLDVSHPSSIS